MFKKQNNVKERYDRKAPQRKQNVKEGYEEESSEEDSDEYEEYLADDGPYEYPPYGYPMPNNKQPLFIPEYSGPLTGAGTGPGRKPKIRHEWVPGGELGGGPGGAPFDALLLSGRFPHKALSTPELPIACEICGEWFSGGPKYAKHFARVHGEAARATSMPVNMGPRKQETSAGRSGVRPQNRTIREHSAPPSSKPSESRKPDEKRDILIYAKNGSTHPALATLDTGSQDNCISEALVVHRLKIPFKRSNDKKWSSFGGNEIAALGTVQLTWRFPNQHKTHSMEFFVQSGQFDVILSKLFAVNEGLIVFSEPANSVPLILVSDNRKSSKAEQGQIEKNRAAALAAAARSAAQYGKQWYRDPSNPNRFYYVDSDGSWVYS